MAIPAEYEITLTYEQTVYLRDAVTYILGRHEWAIGRTSPAEIDKFAHAHCRQRALELLELVDDALSEPAREEAAT